MFTFIRVKIFIILMVCFNGLSMAAFCSEAQLPQKKPVAQAVDQKTKQSVSFQYDDYVMQKDATICFEPLTEELAKDLGAVECNRKDPDFSKWLITFREIPGEPPYTVQMKRAPQEDLATFENVRSCLSSDILKAKNEKSPYKMIVSARGYLPGEELAIRLTGKNKDVFKEIVMCPRPLVLRRKSGQIFARVTLAIGSYNCTSYFIDCLGIKEKETFKFSSTSADEKMKQMLAGPVCMNYMPAVFGLPGGIGKVEVQLEDGSVYELKLPWGIEIFQYLNGKK